MSINVNTRGFNNMVAQFAHFGMAATIVFSGALLFRSHYVFILVGLAIWAIIKELWFDPHFETGGRGAGAKIGKPDVEDFAFYLLGMTVALLVLLFRHLLP